LSQIKEQLSSSWSEKWGLVLTLAKTAKKLWFVAEDRESAGDTG